MIKPELASIEHFDVTPVLPEALQGLSDLARNLAWSWDPGVVSLFVHLDSELWRKTRHNPVLLLKRVSQKRLDELAADQAYLTQLADAMARLEQHRERKGWFHQTHGGGDKTIAYFCAEFALTESLRIYSGGLGVLAGDHLKSASELGLPLVAVGLMYQHGYFQQYLSADGWQMEYRLSQAFDGLPVQPVCGDDGQPLRVCVSMPGREVTIGVWRAEVGRIPLYLLDTNLPENSASDREITSQLYGGDMDMRIRQELVLGIGGVRALEAMAIHPDVCHMNEGHSAFLALERIRKLIQTHGLSFDEARQAAMASHVFTTHTPVPAGIDRFPAELVQMYFADKHQALGLDMEGFLALGRDDVYNKEEPFSMATLAIRTSDWCNGVSKLHGEVSRNMWQRIWPGVHEDEIPIGHVTNGVHVGTWMAPQLADAIDRQLPEHARRDNPADHDLYRAAMDLPDDVFWKIHSELRHKLVAFTKREDPARPGRLGPVRHADNDLDPEALTVGFARRFATYKRGNLFLRDPERLIRLLADTQRPIQFVVAGKAHPADGGGKDLIQKVVRFTQEHGLTGRIVFLENYNMHIARYLVQGCDVWLNNPRRGMEASGTSGMKAAINGGLNCSILDGWWDEADAPEVGWAIGYREEYDNPDLADEIESRSLYELLENQILPAFYDRDEAGVPRKWVQMMKASIAELASVFNTNRMVQQYTEQYYLPAAKRAADLRADSLAGSVARAHHKNHLRQAWPDLGIEDLHTNAGQTLRPGQSLDATVQVHLGGLEPTQVRVQALIGCLDGEGGIIEPQAIDMQADSAATHSPYLYRMAHTIEDCGRYGMALRIIPGGKWMTGVTEPGMIYWHNRQARKPQLAHAGSTRSHR